MSLECSFANSSNRDIIDVGWNNERGLFSWISGDFNRAVLENFIGIRISVFIDNSVIQFPGFGISPEMRTKINSVYEELVSSILMPTLGKEPRVLFTAEYAPVSDSCEVTILYNGPEFAPKNSADDLASWSPDESKASAIP